MKSGLLMGAFCLGLLPWAAHANTIELGIVGNAQVGSNYIDFGQFPTGAPYVPAPGYGTFEISVVNSGVFSTNGATPGEFGMIQSLNEGTGSVTLPGPFMTFDTGASNLQLWATNIPTGTVGPFVLTDTPDGAVASFNVDGYIYDSNAASTVAYFTLTASATFDGQTVASLFNNLPINTPFSATLTETPVGGGGGGVPEPAAWALMLVGVGAVGATLRASRTAKARALLAA